MVCDRRGRVVQSHSIARRAFIAAACFGAVSVVWALVVAFRGGSWWGPLHSFLAGTVLLAISGASQMFTITWSASPAPPAGLVRAQRWLMTAGVAAVLVGVSARIPILTWLGAGSVATSLVGLGLSITRSVRRSLLRRFDLSARFYLLAFAAGAIGVVLGAVIGTSSAGDAYERVRLVHSHLNLVGLVGFTIVGTIPTFLPTVAHHRAVSGQEARVGWWVCVVSAVLILSGLALPREAVGAGTILAGVAAAIVLVGVLARLWEKGRSKLSFLQISAGVSWLAAWAVTDGASLLSGNPAQPFQPWTAAAVVAGVGQVLLGSLAYLVPVLAVLPTDRRRSRLDRWPALPLLAANLAGLSLVLGFTVVAGVLIAVWLADFALRLLTVRPTGHVQA